MPVTGSLKLTVLINSQCPRVLGHGEAPAKEADKAVVESLVAGVLCSHQVVEGQVNLASGDGRSVHFGVQHGVVEQGREEHVRRRGSPRDAVPAVAGRDGEAAALRLQTDGGVVHADGRPVAKVRLFSSAGPADGVFGDVEGLAFIEGSFIPAGHGFRSRGGRGARFQQPENAGRRE